MRFRFTRFAIAALALSASLGHSAQAPKEFKLLEKQHVAMLCALHMANLAIQAQRDPTGGAEESVQHSGRFFSMALMWLPDAKDVNEPVQRRLAEFVIDLPENELMPQASYCAQEARERLQRLAPADLADTSAKGMQQAAKLARSIASGT